MESCVTCQLIFENFTYSFQLCSENEKYLLPFANIMHNLQSTKIILSNPKRMNIFNSLPRWFVAEAGAVTSGMFVTGVVPSNVTKSVELIR